LAKNKIVIAPPLPPLLNPPTLLLAIFIVPRDELGFEMEAFFCRCRGSTRIAGAPWQHFRWRF